MIPVSFGDCFGWLHYAPGSRGVVMCGPHGYEIQSTHRLWRAQACRFAIAGLPALRFDYPGTGDSAGDDADPGRPAAWLAAVEAAIAFLRERTGVEEVVLVGFRLGALLAAVTAERMGGVDGLALLAPPLSGRSYVSQARLLAQMAPPLAGIPAPPPQWAGDLESGGAVLTAETIAALGRLDLLALARSPARRILLMNRPDLPEDARLATHLRDLGAAVETAPLHGYREMVMNNPYFCKAPPQTMAQLTAWAAAGARTSPGARLVPAASPRIEVPTAHEVPVIFGRLGHLFGVWCSPRRLGRDPGPPLVFLNTGSHSHVGANRLTVKLARHLAAAGLPSLRMDGAGFGDSHQLPGHGENEMDSLHSIEDVQAALDWLEREGHSRRAVAIGLCSGAHLAFAAALRDQRIGALVLINPRRFELDDLSIGGIRGWLQRQRRRRMFGELRGWLSCLPGFARRGGRVLEEHLKAWKTHWRFHNLRPHAIAKAFLRLGERNVRILLIYAANDPGRKLLEDSLGPLPTIEAVFPHIRLRIVDGVDHVLTRRWARDHVAGLVEDFLVGVDLAPAQDDGPPVLQPAGGGGHSTPSLMRPRRDSGPARAWWRRSSRPWSPSAPERAE